MNTIHMRIVSFVTIVVVVVAAAVVVIIITTITSTIAVLTIIRIIGKGRERRE